MKIVAGIILYNPDIDRLMDNISAIYQQVESIIIIDNNSINIIEFEEKLTRNNKIKLVKNTSNQGVAKALNQLAIAAIGFNYEWLITLDQDSVVPENLVEIYSRYIGIAKVGLICCKIIDRNFGELSSQQEKRNGWEFVDLCITSASMINLSVWQSVGGFCEEMFIDSVDFDICYLIKENGYKILRTNETALLHEVGKSQKKEFCGREELVFNHSPLRCYYIIRNSLLLGKRHNRRLFFMWVALKRICLVLIYEDDKCNKMNMMLKGFYHAMIGRYGQL